MSNEVVGVTARPKHAPGKALALIGSEAPEATEFRRLLAAIRRRLHSVDNPVVVVTSSRHSEGKSLIASCLAVTAARWRTTRVALVDGDLRRPRIHELMKLPGGAGVAEILQGNLNPDDAGMPTDVDGLTVFLSGEHNSEPSRLLEGPGTSSFLRHLRMNYDFVVIDSPPVVPVSDALLFGADADGLVMVVKAGQTPRAVAMRAREVMEQSEVYLLGVVINNAEEVLPYYYSHRYYGYGY